MKLKSQIEAILFLSDKPVKAAAMARIVAQDVQLVRQALLDLIHDYEERDGGLEIADDDGYIIQVRDAYASIVDEFAPMEMPVSLIRTLSAIAIKQPVQQSEIIKIRGAGAYDHIKELVERELIIKKEEGGRSPQLSTTKKFQEYFRLTQDAKVLRNQLSAVKKEPGEETAEVSADEAQELVAALDGASEAAVHEVAAVAQADSNRADEDNETHELEINHLESRVELEKVFATSPDASLVFRAPVHETASAVSADDEKLNDIASAGTDEDSDS
jgi:segregation and condensation protein B